MNRVMDLDPACGSTPRHTAATTVATPDQACDAWRNVLVCALWRGAIDRSDVLSIALGALDRGGAECDPPPRGVLRASPAAVTRRPRDLRLRATGDLGRRGAALHRVAQCGNELVVGQVPAMLVVEHDVGLAHERERFGRELEPDDPHTYLGVWRIVGAVAWPM